MRCICSTPTPLFNSPDLPGLFTSPLPLDSVGLFRPHEVTLFEGEVVEVLGREKNIVSLHCPSYPTKKPLYSDARFFKKEGAPLSRGMPSIAELQREMEKRIGERYIWGGNDCRGIEKLLTLYPPQKKITSSERDLWRLKGCDCSGLLYEVTRGLTPRNVLWLLTYGREVKKCGKLLPLDMLIWSGHVVLVFDGKHTIESKMEWGGVVKMNLQKRLALIKRERGDDFMVRRFHPETLEVS